MNAARYRRAAAVCAALALAVTACVSRTNNAAPPPAQAPAPPLLEASYDWHGLLLVPFGSVLREMPFTLHEVLLFRDASLAAQSDDPECYAMEQPAPRFVARTPSEYMLCFRHDHLVRVQATVNLPKSDAAQIFADACGLWQRNAAPADAAPAGEPQGCDGRDGAIGYAGRLDQDAEQSDAPLTVTLDSAAQP